jgi:hypothetical protein
LIKNDIPSGFKPYSKLKLQEIKKRGKDWKHTNHLGKPRFSHKGRPFTFFLVPFSKV